MEKDEMENAMKCFRSRVYCQPRDFSSVVRSSYPSKDWREIVHPKGSTGISTTGTLVVVPSDV